MTESVMGADAATTPAPAAMGWTPLDARNARDAERAKNDAKMPSGLGGRVLPDLSIWAQFQRIGGQLTPTQLSNILRDADNGNIRRLMDLANDARQKDCHLSAVLSQSEESIAGLSWKLTLPEKTLARERKVSSLVEEHLRTAVAEPFNALISHQAGAAYYGHSVSETMFAKLDGKILPVDWENHGQRRFAFRLTDGKLVWRDIQMPQNGVDFREENPNKFVVSQPRVTGDVPCREGLVRVLMWAALFRNWDMTDWLRTGEIAWKPWRIGKYVKGKTSKKDLDDLVAILDQLASTGTAALPDNTDLKIEWPGGSGGTKVTHSELFNVLAMEMSKCVLGQTETTQSSTSSGYAQAKVHESVKADILRARARHISAVITRDVIRPMVALNFGPNFLVPRFELVTEDSVDLLSFSSGLKNLTGKGGAGLRIPAKWARSVANIPDPEDDEECIGGVEEPEPEEDPNEPKAKPAEGDDAPTADPEPKDGEPENEPAPEDKPKGKSRRRRR